MICTLHHESKTVTARPVETPDLIPIAREVRLAAQSLARHVKDHTPSLAPHLFTVLAWLEEGPATAGELAVRELTCFPFLGQWVKLVHRVEGIGKWGEVRGGLSLRSSVMMR